MIRDETGESVAGNSGFTAPQADPATLGELRLNGLQHVVRWREVPPPQDQLSRQAVLVACDGLSAVGRALAAALRSAGCAVTEAVIGAARLEAADSSRYEVPANLPAYESFFAALSERVIDIAVYVAPEQDGAVGLSPVGESIAGNARQFSDDAALRLFEFVKAMTSADMGVSQLCVLASNVDRISGTETHSAPWLATLFGLAKAIGHEGNGLTGRSVDVDETTDVSVIARQVLARNGAGAVGLRQGRCFVPELVPHFAAPVLADARVTRAHDGVDGACLITGGAGGLGLAVARHLAAAQPGVQLALAGRTLLPPREQWQALAANGTPHGHLLATFLELEELGAQVRYYPTDVAQADQVTELIDAVHAEFGRISLIVHSAGRPGSGLLLRKDTATFAATLSPKTAGTWHLDAATADEAPEMILFASTMGLFGGVGQSDYIAANSFLDSFADYRSALGRRTIAVDWSDWLDTGMAADHGLQADRGFFLSLRASAGLASFDEIRAGHENRVVVGQVNLPFLRSLPEREWSWWCHNSPVRLPAEFIAAVGQDRARAASRDLPVATAEAAVPAGYRQVTPLGRPDNSYSETEIQVAQIWGRELDLTELNVFENSFDLGGNSLTALRIAQNIERKLGVRVRVAALFRHATIADLAAHIDMLRDE